MTIALQFARAALNKNVQVFVLHVTSLTLNLMSIHLAKKAEIVSLITKEVKIPTNYSDFSNVFSEEKALILPKIIDLNQYAIKLQENQQPLYRPIYSLGLVELEMLKIYIKTNLANSFIWPLKLLAGA